MHIKQLLRHLFLGEDVEIIKAPLPHLSSNHIMYFSSRTLLHNLQNRGKCSTLRLAQEQMNMFGHDHISCHSKQIFLARLFKHLQKNIPRFGCIQKRKPMVAAERNEVEIISSV